MENVHRLVERRTPQAYGGGKGTPLTGNAEGEEIVNSCMKVQVVNVISENMRTKYTNEDIEFLREYYPVGDWNAIFTRFPNLDKDKIYNVCHKRGISANYFERDKDVRIKRYKNMAKNRRPWTENELEILSMNYSFKSVPEIMQLLPGRTYDAIVARAKKLSLISRTRQQQLYSKDDICFIKDNWMSMSDEEISLHLNRTQRSVKTMRSNLDLFRQDKEKRHYEDLTKFFRGQIHQWKKNSIEKCNFQCALTGSKEFAIHHIISFNIIVKNFFCEYDIQLKDSFEDYTNDELNQISEIFIEYHNQYPLGVCVDKDLHKLFHKMYGDINNEAQWDVFVKKFNEGEILH